MREDRACAQRKYFRLFLGRCPAAKQKADQEQEEQDFGNPRGSDINPGKSEDRGYQRDDQKDHSVVQHRFVESPSAGFDARLGPTLPLTYTPEIRPSPAPLRLPGSS